ncbi:hypothetical protein [Streptomyces flavofungini]|uniref:Integral membrane protein n=1 Tax=Streptomyces flavofungini TaxID=68200 RepID=A0ABS0X8U2_9ACTN|nr:hypothetical protein [Streptomyces flavofungini]MBJ3809624.1 hypothetical protein [Streptomyces flavofungini]GHC55838.1 hypothetical protein GCM10010349_22930 [Streptomyces flavofungini]
MAQPDEVTLGRVLLTEYEQLKAEQTGRIRLRDNFLYAMLAATAAVIASTMRVGDHLALLLLLPPIALLLGWTYLVNDEKISAIGRHVRTTLAPRLAEVLDADEEILTWESAHRDDHRRGSRKALQLAVDLLAFTVSPLAALTAFWVNGHLTWPLLAVSGAETAAVGVLAWQIVGYADLGRG